MQTTLKEKLASILASASSTKQRREAESAENDSFIKEFFRGPVSEAFHEFKAALEASGRTVRISIQNNWAQIASHSGTTEEFCLDIRQEGDQYVIPVHHHIDRNTKEKFRSLGFFRQHDHENARKITKEEILEHLLAQYSERVHQGW